MRELSSFSGLVLGYTGCDKEVGEAALANPSPTGLVASNNGYDWLGTGIYFWERDPVRAMQWAEEASARHKERNKREGTPVKIQRPFVVGAVIRLGTCLDLTTLGGNRLIKTGYRGLAADWEVIQSQNPNFQPPLNTPDEDMKGRYLDFSVINWTCQKYVSLHHRPIDTVRSFFHEGDRTYPGAAFRELTHIQICVREPKNSLMALFRVPENLELISGNH